MNNTLKYFFLKQKSNILAVLLLVFFVTLILYPLLFGGKVFFNEEQYGFYYPMSFYVQDSLHSNGSLLWNNAYYGGVSASLDQFVGANYPVNKFLFNYLDFFTAHHLSIFLALLIGTLITYWFGKSNGWLTTSSIVLAITYVLATTLDWIGIGTIAAHSFILFPAMALALLKIRENKNFLAYVLFGGLGFGVALLAGFIQIVFYVYPILLLYAIFLDSKYWRTETTQIKKHRSLLGFILMSVVGTLVGLKQLLPSVFFIDLTIRTSDYAIQNASNPHILELITFLLPDFIKIPFIGAGSHGFYIGTLAIVFTVFALVYYRSRRVGFFLFIYAVVLGFAFHLPIFSWLNEHIPPYSNMGGNFRWMLAGAFPLAFLSASGVEGYLRNPEIISNKVKQLTSRILFILSSLLIIGSALVAYILNTISTNETLKNFIIDKVFSNKEMVFPREHYIGVLEKTANGLLEVFSFANTEYTLSLFFWFMSALFFYLLYKSDWFVKNRKQIIILFVFFNALFVFQAQSEAFVDKNLYLEKPEIVNYFESIENNPNEYRVMGFLLGDGPYREVTSKIDISNTDTVTLQRELMINNSNLYWGIQRMDGMEPYRTMRHNRLINTVISQERSSFVFDADLSKESEMNKLDNYDVLVEVGLEEKIEDFTRKLPLLSMMNVKYIYSIYDLNSPSLKKVFDNTISLENDITLEYKVYENKLFLPRLYYASKTVFTDDDELEILRHLAETTDFKKNTFIECGNCETINPYKGGGISIKRYENGHVELESVSKGENWLVFSESYMPGWVAFVDGVETPIYRANYLFQAIMVPEGEHKITFKYEDIVGLKFAEYKNKLFK